MVKEARFSMGQLQHINPALRDQILAKIELAKKTRSKYGAKKIVFDGYRFDSKKEGRYYLELKARRTAGEISAFELQPKYPVEINGKKICTYRADFRVHYPNGTVEIIDVKGMRTPMYRLKKKLIEAIYNIKIVEV